MNARGAVRRESAEELQRLRDQRRINLQPGEDLWVFGYGSLMWRPGFPHLEVRLARLFGYHRRFCIFSHHHRGTPEVPGLIFGLDRGGSCRGLAYRIPSGEAEAAMEYLYDREMVTGVYIPRRVSLMTDEGEVRAVTFIVDHGHFQYAGHLPLGQMVEVVCQGHGAGGSCVEYLTNTLRHLDALGIHDRGLQVLLSAVNAHLE